MLIGQQHPIRAHLGSGLDTPEPLHTSLAVTFWPGRRRSAILVHRHLSHAVCEGRLAKVVTFIVIAGGTFCAGLALFVLLVKWLAGG